MIVMNASLEASRNVRTVRVNQTCPICGWSDASLCCWII